MMVKDCEKETSGGRMESRGIGDDWWRLVQRSKWLSVCGSGIS